MSKKNNVRKNSKARDAELLEARAIAEWTVAMGGIATEEKREPVHLKAFAELEALKEPIVPETAIDELLSSFEEEMCWKTKADQYNILGHEYMGWAKAEMEKAAVSEKAATALAKRLAEVNSLIREKKREIEDAILPDPKRGVQGNQKIAEALKAFQGHPKWNEIANKAQELINRLTASAVAGLLQEGEELLLQKEEAEANKREHTKNADRYGLRARRLFLARDLCLVKGGFPVPERKEVKKSK